MGPTLIATIAGLTTALCWGTGDYLAAKSTKQLSTTRVNLAFGSMGLVSAAILLLVANPHIPSGRQTAIIALSTGLITTAFLLFVKALSTGIVGIVVPIGNSYPLVTVLLSATILSVSLSLGQLGAILGIVLGVAFLAYEKNHKKIPLRELHRELILAIGAAITWGVAFFVLDPIVDEISWQTLAVTSSIFGFIFAMIVSLAAERTKIVQAVKQALTTKTVLLGAAIGSFGMLAFYAGCDYGGSVIIPTVLSSAGPLVASFWGAVIDHEKIGALKRFGAILVVAGIIVLNIY